MTVPSPPILVVGSASRDVTTDDPRGWRLGGGVTFASLALARLGLSVRALVGVDGQAALAPELGVIRSAGAIVALVELESGPVFENIETPAGRRQRCLATSDPIPLTALPRAWTTGFAALVLAPVAGELGEEWALLTDGDASPIVALGWQGLLRELVPGSDVVRVAPASSPLVLAADIVAVSRDDVARETANPEHLFALLAPGATLIVTDGEVGGLVLRRDRMGGRAEASPYPAIPSDGAVDPTGAGDVFLAALLATLVHPALADGFDDPTTFAAAAASLTVEAPGIAGVPDLASIRRRAARAPSLASRRPSAASSRGRGRPSQA